MTKTNAVFGTYYENIPYSKNEYIYPAFFENNIHIITSARNNIAVKTKEDLKNFKGVYSADDRFSSFVLKDFKSLGIKEAKDYPEAYRQLLSGEADYVVVMLFTAKRLSGKCLCLSGQCRGLQSILVWNI